MNEVESRPFSEEYVLKVTFQNMIKDIDRSINKTHSRLDDRPDLTPKILNCIAQLVQVRKVMEQMQEHNKHLTGDV